MFLSVYGFCVFVSFAISFIYFYFTYNKKDCEIKINKMTFYTLSCQELFFNENDETYFDSFTMIERAKDVARGVYATIFNESNFDFTFSIEETEYKHLLKVCVIGSQGCLKLRLYIEGCFRELILKSSVLPNGLTQEMKRQLKNEVKMINLDHLYFRKTKAKVKQTL